MGLGAGIVIAAGIVWLGLLFGVALYGERHARVFENRWAIVYALSLAVHCTSWTFYGVVTQVSRSGWWLPPTFIGAILLYMVGVGLLRRMVELAREHNASSLADLIAARLGRHSGLAALVTAVMLFGIVLMLFLYFPGFQYITRAGNPPLAHALETVPVTPETKFVEG